ncbi:MAG: hypothetical protein ACI9TY_000480 [Alphaproteobacteria bacterium]|jgi:hypothetical protein
MKTTLPTDDPYAVVVQSLDELTSLHLENKELELTLMLTEGLEPKIQQVIERIAVLDLDVNFGIYFNAIDNDYDFIVSGNEGLFQDEWQKAVCRFVKSDLGLPAQQAMAFMKWLEFEMFEALFILESLKLKNENMQVHFRNNRTNLQNTRGNVDFWHIDRNAYVGMKMYHGEGTLYAPRGTIEDKHLRCRHLPNDARKFTPYQLPHNGICLHKGIRSAADAKAAVHKAPYGKKSKKPRSFLLMSIG